MNRFVMLAGAVAIAACSAQPQPQATETAQETTSQETTTVSEPQMQSDGFRLLEKGDFGKAAQTEDPAVGRRAPRVVTAAAEAEYRNLWREHVSDQTAPPVDFNRESVVFLLMGVQSTGGYSVDPKRAFRQGAAVVVDAEVTQPGRGGIVTQAITAPFAVLAVPGRLAGDVDWMNEGRLLARAARE